MPDPGLYPSIPARDYHDWPEANFSKLKGFSRTPLHAREAWTHPPEPTVAMVLGDALHAAVLEPDRFMAEYTVAPKFDRRFKDQKLAWKAWEEANEGKTIIDQGEMDRVDIARDRLRDHPVVRELMAGGHTELSFVWDDELTGVRCKGRADRVGTFHERTVVVDLKSTRDASPKAFARAAANFYYPAQAAFYLDGLQAAAPGPSPRKFLWVAVELTRPFGIAVYEADAATVDFGRWQMQRWLEQWRTCHDDHVWPDYSNHIQPLRLPRWAYTNEDQE